MGILSRAGSPVPARPVAGPLTSLGRRVCSPCVTKVITVRLREEELARCDAEARRLGLTRTEYVRYRLFRDTGGAGHAGRAFLSQDLVGAWAIGAGSGNAQVRAALARRAR